jgi:hypothetical protein
MTITVNTRAYTFDVNPSADSARYVGPANDFDTKDILELKRTPPKPTTTFPGVARASGKFSRTVVIGGVSYTALVEVNTSLPVGMAEADVDLIRDDMGDFLISSNGDDLFFKHKIVQ